MVKKRGRKVQNAALEMHGSPIRLAKAMKLQPEEEIQPSIRMAASADIDGGEILGDISWGSLVMWGLLIFGSGMLLAYLCWHLGAPVAEKLIPEGAASVITNTTGI